jgi:hypothetical protein
MQLNYTTLVATCPQSLHSMEEKMVRCFLSPLQDVKGELSLKIWWKKKKNRLSNIPIPTKPAKVKGIIIDTNYRTEHKDKM